MKWSWTIGRIAGIKVRIHWTFLLLLAWVATSFAGGGNWRDALGAVGFIAAVFACIVAHEAGHALMARRYGVTTDDITLLPIGGLARMQRIPSEPWHEFWIAVAGPAVTAGIALLLFVGLAAANGAGVALREPGVATSFLINLMWVNITLLVFNLLPAFPMDGGRMLRAVLAMRMDYARATDIAATIGQGMAILFAIVGFFSNFFLLFIALFVYLGAEAEAQAARLKATLGDSPVRDAMMTDFRTLDADDTLDTAVDALLAGAQQDFPVADGEQFRGILRSQDLVEAVRKRGSATRVADVAKPIDHRVAETDGLQETLDVLHRLHCRSLPVFRNGDVVGLVSLDNIAELVMIRTALAGRDAAAAHAAELGSS
jgi:Zn-dependent protease